MLLLFCELRVSQFDESYKGKDIKEMNLKTNKILI